MIFFCDIDGVLIPGRAYYMAGQTWPLVSKFDPCAVGLLNSLCQVLSGQIVVHSNWRGTEQRRIGHGMKPLSEHFVEQGILPQYMHPDPLCPTCEEGRDRWKDIRLWLREHPEVAPEDFWILEDTCPPWGWVHADRVVQTKFDEGLTVEQYLRIRTESGSAFSSLLVPRV